LLNSGVPRSEKRKCSKKIVLEFKTSENLNMISLENVSFFRYLGRAETLE
jgi:hypothetical protein